MRIWGSEHEDVRKLMNFQEKAKEHSSGCMIVEICEDFRFATDKIKSTTEPDSLWKLDKVKKRLLFLLENSRELKDNSFKAYETS